MSNSWPQLPLGEVLTKSEEWATINPTDTYRELTVRLWGKGVTLRRVANGSEIASARRLVAKAGQFILSRIDARNGALGLVPDSLDGAVVSNDFPLFTPNPSRLDPSFLDWMSKTQSFVDICKAASEGTTNRVRLQEDRFLRMTIPLPPLPEQRRIVARIEELAGKINEARSLRQRAAEEAEAIVSRAISSLLDEGGWPIHPLGGLLAESPRNGLSPKPEIESNGRPMLRINAVSSSPTRFVDLTAIKLVEVSDAEAAPFELRNNDVFIVRYNGDINRVAKPGIYKGSGPCYSVYPDKLMRLRPDRSTMIPDFLVFALCSRSVREQVEEIGKTTAGNIGISGGNAKSFRVSVPPLTEQHRIVGELDALQSRVDALKKLQAATIAELDAMLPSVLDRAFRGAL